MWRIPRPSAQKTMPFSEVTTAPFAWEGQVAGGASKPQQHNKGLEPPPEVVVQQQQLRNSAPLASPGSHSSALKTRREGLKMSPPSYEPATDPTPASSKGIPLSEMSWNNPSGTHLWSAPAQARRPAAAGGSSRRRRRGVGGGGGGGMRLPLQSPVRRLEWWQRPPSPLVSHMRPLWVSSPGPGHDNKSRDFTAAARIREPEEGEAAAGGPQQQQQRMFLLDSKSHQVSNMHRSRVRIRGLPLSSWDDVSRRFVALCVTARRRRCRLSNVFIFVRCYRRRNYPFCCNSCKALESCIHPSRAEGVAKESRDKSWSLVIYNSSSSYYIYYLYRQRCFFFKLDYTS